MGQIGFDAISIERASFKNNIAGVSSNTYNYHPKDGIYTMKTFIFLLIF
jgi:hypothetical protein